MCNLQILQACEMQHFGRFFSTISMFLNVYYYNWTNICTSFVLNDKKDIMDIIWRGVRVLINSQTPNSKLLINHRGSERRFWCLLFYWINIKRWYIKWFHCKITIVEKPLINITCIKFVVLFTNNILNFKDCVNFI